MAPGWFGEVGLSGRRVSVLIGLDAGTSVVKAAAFAANGDVLAVASRPTRTLVPGPGRTEQVLEEVITAAGEAIR